MQGTDFVYCWVDGIHLKVRLEQDKVCLLVMIGVRADGSKELIALDDGHRESTESWLDLLRSCKRRGMRAPVLASGDGALGFWGALREVFPAAREQRSWTEADGALPSLYLSHGAPPLFDDGPWMRDLHTHLLAGEGHLSVALGSLDAMLDELVATL